MSWRRSSPRVLAWGALLALTAVACVQPNDPGVGVSNIPADIVFGVKAEDDAKPANTDPRPAEGASLSDDGGLPPQIFTETPKKSFPRPPLRARRTADDCPPAALNEFPDETAPLNVPPDESRLPNEGLYRWQKAGSQTTLQGTELPISGFETRAIRNAELVTLEEERIVFTYETVQPEFAGSTNVVVTTFQVDTDAESAEANSTATPHRFSAGEPERGLVIKRIEVLDEEGETLSTFQPVTGLLILPLPVRTGEQFSSVAIDPRSRFTIQYEAQTVRRSRVDACGEIIEGWLVEGHMTTSDGDNRKYDTIIAPHLGAILLNEAATVRNEAGEFDLDFTIGQREPDPVEEDGG